MPTKSDYFGKNVMIVPVTPSIVSGSVARRDSFLSKMIESIHYQIGKVDNKGREV